MKFYAVIKRAADIILSLTALILLSPLFLVIAVSIKADSKGPVFFKQKRIGKNKKEFYILKFRSMRCDTPKDMPTHLFKNSDMFITKTGKFLRSTSLDELPQLINIFKGEMSIIGPRPALWNQYDLIAERDKYKANDILPGLTGWAQINGRDQVTIKDKARYDGEYIENFGIIMDIKVFLKTVGFVAKRTGIVEGKTEGEAEAAAARHEEAEVVAERRIG